MLKQRYVAFMDVLGFRTIVSVKGEEFVGQQLSSLFNHALVAALNNETTTVEDRLVNPQIKSNIEFVLFSDSVLLYTPDDSPEYLEEMIYILNRFMTRTIFHGFPLRGGLVKGNLYVDPPNFVGQAQIKAYDLEQVQEWSGIIVHESCFETSAEMQVRDKLLASKDIIETLVPEKGFITKRKRIKERVRLKRRVVINWPEYAGVWFRGKEDFKRRFSENTGEPTNIKAKRKRDYTVKFLMENLGASKKPPALQFKAEFPASLTIPPSK
ncbi:hypothetical protein [Brevibacillus aydinogluensis]|uniref:Guanylate cyclase domain-containing protein n=1 Tax=Brevibacillus aydinogluensis TaxID=927786 RepID=A0AA48RFX1_9BACL|nr:hypothetical protein [Brevibacillus aydinogluensis]CAJ1001050.1 hypothetical protein BSPP4475_01760 [Brevibacillus aydinogluensis]